MPTETIVVAGAVEQFVVGQRGEPGPQGVHGSAQTSVVDVTGARVLGIADRFAYIEMTHATLNVLTVPLDSAFLPGIWGDRDQVAVVWAGAGLTRVEAASGVTIKKAFSLSLYNRESTGILTHLSAANTWRLSGETALE